MNLQTPAVKHFKLFVLTNFPYSLITQTQCFQSGLASGSFFGLTQFPSYNHGPGKWKEMSTK